MRASLLALTLMLGACASPGGYVVLLPEDNADSRVVISNDRGSTTVSFSKSNL